MRPPKRFNGLCEPDASPRTRNPSLHARKRSPGNFRPWLARSRRTPSRGLLRPHPFRGLLSSSELSKPLFFSHGICGSHERLAHAAVLCQPYRGAHAARVVPDTDDLVATQPLPDAPRAAAFVRAESERGRRVSRVLEDRDDVDVDVVTGGRVRPQPKHARWRGSLKTGRRRHRSTGETGCARRSRGFPAGTVRARSGCGRCSRRSGRSGRSRRSRRGTNGERRAQCVGARAVVLANHSTGAARGSVAPARRGRRGPVVCRGTRWLTTRRRSRAGE